MTRPNSYALCPHCGVGLVWRSRTIETPTCPVCPPNVDPPQIVPFATVRSKLRLALDNSFLGHSPTDETARIAAAFIAARTTPDGFRRWFLTRLGDQAGLRLDPTGWVGSYLGSILPGLPLWVKIVGGYPGAYVSGGRYGARVGPPSWLLDWIQAAEAVATVDHGTWMGMPKTARTLPRAEALRLLDHLATAADEPVATRHPGTEGRPHGDEDRAP